MGAVAKLPFDDELDEQFGKNMRRHRSHQSPQRFSIVVEQVTNNNNGGAEVGGCIELTFVFVLFCFFCSLLFSFVSCVSFVSFVQYAGPKISSQCFTGWFENDQ